MEGKIIDFKEENTKNNVETWANHPDVQIGCSFFITSLMMQGFSKYILDQTIKDEKGPEEEELIKTCIFEGAQRYMQGEDGNAKAFSPLQLRGNLQTGVKYLNQFLKQIDPDVFGDGSKSLTKAAEEIKVELSKNNIRLLSISGKKGSGKDEVATAITGISEYPVRVIKFADALKEAVCGMTGCSRKDLESQDYKSKPNDVLGTTMRDFLQRFGTEAMRDTFGENFWVQCLIPRLKGAIKDLEGGFVCVTDTRFTSEIEFLEACGAEIIRIERPSIDTGDTHASETALDGYEFSTTIVNEGTIDDLYKKVEDVIK